MKEETPDDVSLKSASEFIQPVVEKFYPPEGAVQGTPLEWAKIPVRVFPGEVSIWFGINGHGKSLLLNQIMLGLACKGEPGGIASFEMPAPKTLYRMVRQALGKENPTEAEIKDCMRWLGDKIYIYDKTGTGNAEALRRVFNRARAQQKVQHFLIDSLMKCGIDPDDYAKQKKFVDLFQNFAQDYGVHINIIAHARKSKDEDDRPGKMDVKGASEITDLADNVFSIWRNKNKQDLVKQYFETRMLPKGITYEELLKRPDCILDCCKHREMGGDAEGQYGLYFHRPSMQFIETVEYKPIEYFGLP